MGNSNQPCLGAGDLSASLSFHNENSLKGYGIVGAPSKNFNRVLRNRLRFFPGILRNISPKAVPVAAWRESPPRKIDRFRTPRVVGYRVPPGFDGAACIRVRSGATRRPLPENFEPGPPRRYALPGPVDTSARRAQPAPRLASAVRSGGTQLSFGLAAKDVF
jgi:hypothetical protein